jgi:NADPH:quinone reductase-like Zn-dependent oxidoreductase
MISFETIAPLVYATIVFLSPLGYSCAGVILSLGHEVEGIAPGDRVACAGGGWANQAEVVAVPRSLLARHAASPDAAPAMERQ